MKDEEASKKFLALPAPSYPQDRKRNNDKHGNKKNTWGRT